MDAPLVDDPEPTFDADAVKFNVAVPGNVRRIPTPAIVAHQGVTNAEEREEDDGGDGEEHIGRLLRLLRLVYIFGKHSDKDSWWAIGH